ncbi:MAG: 5-bromo-4-chloroindolyl phosphate hydrolysis family protein [Deltaproteobacteria bacterium]|jgi:hypothetical protein|nr:5-bromo-4-chloroindolyl phosphate hydrolysis family protein [Deltaproteobacteria bacterium]
MAAAKPEEPGKPRTDDDALSLAAWGRAAVAGVRGFGMRLFVHTAALLCGLTAGSSLLTGLCVYVGLICLAARGISLRSDWLTPALSGLAQTAVLMPAGFPPEQALFWGGAQAWLQRLLLKRLRMGSEWLALLLLLPLGMRLVSALPTLAALAALAVSFAGIGLAGFAAGRFFAWRGNAPAQSPEGPPEPPRIAAHRASLAGINDKAARLPRSVRGLVESIARSAGNILDYMAANPRDLETGHRFLARYLNAAHAVVDKHLRLAREEVITPETAEALARSEETLARLEAAFAGEYARFLSNDATDFTADLAVLDTLLKMDGR